MGGMAALYVALGDSMSIDDYAGGHGRGAASLLHRNRDADFPDWHGRDLADHEIQNLARDSATVLDVLHRQLPAMTRPPSLVTLTMGGNDLLSAYGVTGPDAGAAESAVGRVATIGEAVLVQLRRLAGDGCRIIVTTIYDPTDGTGDMHSVLSGSWPEGLQFLAQANAVLTDLAGRHGAAVADVHRHFAGHGNHAGDPSQTDAYPANRELWYCGAVEPNGWGAHEIRRVWWDQAQF
jgi:lysophospholipase L1-like esterase